MRNRHRGEIDARVTPDSAGNRLPTQGQLAQAILSQASEAIVVCNTNGQIIQANEAAHKLCGSNPIGEMFPHAFDLQSVRSSPFSPTGPDPVRPQRVESLLVRGQETLELLVSIGPLLDGQDGLLGTVVTLTDISERKRAEEEILAAQAKMEHLLVEADQSRRALLSLVEEQQQTEAALKERLKEMACLYAIRRDMSMSITTEALCERIVDHLKAAMQFPEVTVPFLVLQGKQFTTEQFHPDLNHNLAVDLVVSGEKRGELRVYYTENRPFLLPEEQDLLEAIAEALQLWLARQQAEVARQKSERLLHETQALSKIGGWEYNVEAESITWTDEIHRILGIEEGARLNDIEYALSFYSDQHRKRLEEAFMTAVATGQPFGVELELTAGDGRRKSVYVSGKPALENGQLVKMVGYLMDITERKQHEREQEAIVTISAALRQAETRADMLPTILDQLLNLLQADGASLVIYDPATDTAVIEEARGELRREGILQAVPIENSITGKVITSGQPFITADIQQETGLYRNDQFGRIKAAICSPLLTQEQAIGAIWVGRRNEFSSGDLRLLATLADISANAIYRTTLYEQTVTQAEQIEQIINSVPDGVLLLDQRHHVVLANPAARAHLKLLAASHVGETVTQLGDKLLSDLLSSPQAQEWHNLTVGNSIFEAIARPLAARPTMGGWVLVLRDVTQQRLVQQQLQQQERLAAIGQLAAGIAHDFNNLLAVITLYSQLLAQSPNLSPGDRERLATIRGQVGHAASMIQQILDFSRRAVLKRQPLDLRLFLKEQVELLRRTLPEHIEIRWECKAEICLVQGDPTRIQQAVMNLALNARDAMPGGGQLTLKLDRFVLEESQAASLPAIPTGEWMRLTMTDTGVGISARHLRNLFEPFFTTKGPDKGTGLGLAQVHGIVAQHGGYITVDSQLQRGTTFTIYLPAVVTEGELQPSQGQFATPQGNGELILVVEDDVMLRMALTEYLQIWGYQTIGVANGAEALNLLNRQQKHVDLILSDVIMPRMGGINLLRELRQVDRQLPVILLTGHPLEEEVIITLRSEGLQTWLPKPPDLNQLAQTIASLLAKSKE